MSWDAQFDLIDHHGHRLTRVTVTEHDGDLVHAVMDDSGLAEHGGLFLAWQHAVEEQRLSDVDRLDRQIASLAITAVGLESGRRRATSDLQIWPDGLLTFRLSEPLAAEKSNVA